MFKKKKKKCNTGADRSKAERPFTDVRVRGGTHLFGQQGDEVALKLRLNHLHHMLDLCGLAAVYQLIQRQQLFWTSPALKTHTAKTMCMGII